MEIDSLDSLQSGNFALKEDVGNNLWQD